MNWIEVPGSKHNDLRHMRQQRADGRAAASHGLGTAAYRNGCLQEGRQVQQSLVDMLKAAFTQSLVFGNIAAMFNVSTRLF